MKKTFSLLLVLFCSLTLWAEKFEYNEIFYNTISDSTAEVHFQAWWGFSGYQRDTIAIPPTVDYNGRTYRVVGIVQSAFFDFTSLITVSIPNTVTTIGISAFTNCTNLSKVLIPSSVQTIGSAAFAYCTSLKEVTCLAPIPPTCGELVLNDYEMFYGVDVSNVLLYVPVESIDLYKKAEYWKDFKIVPYYSSEECYEYQHVNMSVRVFGKSSIIFDLSNNGTIDPPYVDSIWIVNTDQEPLRKLYAQSRDTIDISFLEERGTYILRVYIDGCIKSRTFVYRNVQNKWSDTWCDTWNVFVENGSVYPPHEETYRYQLVKDIVIGEHTYTAVVSKAINDAHDAPRYVAAVRFTDDRKVYIYYDNAEYLLYDFNVQEGDELEVFAGINNYTSDIKTYKCTVTSIEQYACVGCPAAITLEVHNHPDDFREFYRQTQWIEGVGDINGFLNGINHYVEMDGGGSEYLLCAYKGDELKYTGDLYEEYGCGDDAEQTPEDLFPTLWGLQRTACSEYTDCEENVTYLMQFDEIKEINGKLYLKCGGVFLREEDNKVLIYSFPYEKDLVLYDWTLEIGDTLQNLGIDPYSFPELEYAAIVDYIAYEDYDEEIGDFIIKKEPLGNKRVKDISTIRLLDGNEYKAWLFGYDWERGDYYIEGIGNANKYGGDYVDLAHPFAVPTCYYGERLVCVSRDGVLLYQIDDAEMERLGTDCLCDGYIDTSVETNTTPNGDTQKFIHNNHLLILRDGKTYNVMGMEVTK